MAKYMMALDSGTTSNRCILFDESGEICSVAQKEFTQIFPKPGWVEHDAQEIFTTQLEVARQAIAAVGATAADIAAIGITNQRETTICWDRHTGKPVYHAIVWQCRRTAEYCDRLTKDGLVDTIREKTGLVIDPYFSGTKIRWILENVPGVRQRAEAGDILFGTVETWLRGIGIGEKVGRLLFCIAGNLLFLAGGVVQQVRDRLAGMGPQTDGGRVVRKNQHPIFLPGVVHRLF